MIADPRLSPGNSLPIYLDNQATTPMDRRVLTAMLPYFTEHFGNPNSTSHPQGRIAAEAVEQARAAVARVIQADPREIVFTSGATESNNLAIKGAARFARDRQESPRNRIVTLQTEHKCVIESCRQLEREGFQVTYMTVGADGLVDLDALQSAVTEETLLVSILAAHNEIGTVQPLAEIGAICRTKGILFHTDAAQAFGKVPLDVAAMAIDLMSISGHKIYGPKGIGALYVRRRPRTRLEPLFDGGGQERGFRSGTLPTPLCVGLGHAASLALDEMAGEAARLEQLRDMLFAALSLNLPEMRLNGHPTRRLPGNLNLSISGVPAIELIAACPRIAVSTGSACTSAVVEPSYVLRAIGLSDEVANEAVRIGLGRFTTAAEIGIAAEALTQAATSVRDAGFMAE